MEPRKNSVNAGHPAQYLVNRELFNPIYPRKSLIKYQIEKAHNFYSKNLVGHWGCVNALEFTSDGSLMSSGGDDKRVFIWNVAKAISDEQKLPDPSQRSNQVSNPEPTILKAEHSSNVFALEFNCSKKLLFSGGNDNNLIVHDLSTGAALDIFLHDSPIYGISSPYDNENLFGSASDGKLHIYDVRSSNEEPFLLGTSSSSFHSIHYHPLETRLLVSSSGAGVDLWDIRMPKKSCLKYGGGHSEHAMSARFNCTGDKILAIKRRLPAVLYSTRSPKHMFQFNHPGYYNSCTMKSCSFAGEGDEYVMSGSDNFNLYMWKIPTDENADSWVDRAHLVLKGHRSIVNQVRYNPVYSIIASSGVEKIIKFWSPFNIQNPSKSREKDRTIYTHDQYIEMVMQTGLFSGDTTSMTTTEDTRMYAFFDALIVRDIEAFDDNQANTPVRRKAKSIPLIFSDDSSNLTLYSSSSSSSDDEDNNGTSRKLAIVENREVSDSSSDSDLIDPDLGQALNHIPIINDEELQNPEDSVRTPVSSDIEENQDRIRNENGNVCDNSDEENIITKMIVERQAHLKKMARAQIESKIKKRACQSLVDPSSSSSSSSESSPSSSSESFEESSVSLLRKYASKRKKSLSLSETLPRKKRRSLSTSHSYRRKTIPSRKSKSHNKMFAYLRSLRYESEDRTKSPTRDDTSLRNSSVDEVPCCSRSLLRKNRQILSSSASSSSSSDSEAEKPPHAATYESESSNIEMDGLRDIRRKLSALKRRKDLISSKGESSESSGESPSCNSARQRERKVGKREDQSKSASSDDGEGKNKDIKEIELKNVKTQMIWDQMILNERLLSDSDSEKDKVKNEANQSSQSPTTQASSTHVLSFNLERTNELSNISPSSTPNPAEPDLKPAPDVKFKKISKTERNYRRRSRDSD